MLNRPRRGEIGEERPRRRRRTAEVLFVPPALGESLESVRRELGSLAAARECGILSAEELCRLAALEEELADLDPVVITAGGGRRLRVPLESLPRLSSAGVAAPAGVGGGDSLGGGPRDRLSGTYTRGQNEKGNGAAGARRSGWRRGG